ncbi:MAG: hypothetical protein ACI4C7_09770 [Clostridia bacterium]
MKKIVTLFTIISVLLSFCSVIPTSAAEPDVKCSFGYVTGTDYGDVWYYEYDAFADYVSKNEGYISFDTEKYDKVFFENNDLWMCPLTESNESSGSRFEVTDIQYNNDNRFYVSTKRTEIGNTDNCVTWMLIIEVTKEYGGLLSAYIYNENNPVVISSLDDLEKLRDSVNSGDTYEGRTVMLAADIDMSEKYGENINGETVSWTPIGTEEHPFNGTFEGNGHAINLYINTTNNDNPPNYLGLFGYTQNNANIRNLIIDGTIKVSTITYFGGIPENAEYYYVGSIMGCNNGSIENCHNKIRQLSVSGNTDFAGGIAGVSFGSINHCSNIGIVTGTQGTSGTVSGGICGIVKEKSIINNCYNTGKILGFAAGGIAGYTEDNIAGIINCYNTDTNVKGNGISGNACSAIKNCYQLEIKYLAEQEGVAIKTTEQFESGEVAYLLGDEWGQTIGVDKYPVLGGSKVYFANNTYTNTKPEHKYPYQITGLRLTDTSGNEIIAPEQGKNFIVETDIVKTEERNEKDYLFVAVYDEKGALMNIDYVKAKFTVDGECSFGFNISAQSEPIKEIKAYVWESFSSITPLAESKTLVFSD